MRTEAEGVGFQDTSTSRAAADRVESKVGALRRRTLEAIRLQPQTSWEVALTLGEPFMNIQPRCSELFRDGHIFDSGRRGAARSGPTRAIVWRVGGK